MPKYSMRVSELKKLSSSAAKEPNATRATVLCSLSSLKQQRGRTACEWKSKVQLCDVFLESARCEWEIKWSETNSLHIVWGVLESFNCINFPLEIFLNFNWIVLQLIEQKFPSSHFKSYCIKIHLSRWSCKKKVLSFSTRRSIKVKVINFYCDDKWHWQSILLSSLNSLPPYDDDIFLFTFFSYREE